MDKGCVRFDAIREIGSEHATGLAWLRGEIIDGARLEEAPFLFNARLYANGLKTERVIVDNFPLAPPPKGWVLLPNMRHDGFSLVAEGDRSRVLFGYSVEDNVCHVTTNLYNADGSLVAETSEQDFIVHRGQLLMGRQCLRIDYGFPSVADQMT